MRDLTRHYDKLTPDERFRLFIDAAGRNDIQELDRLNDSCPRKDYRQEDSAYTRRKMQFFNMAMLHAIEVTSTDRDAFAAFAFLLAYGGDEAAEPAVTKLEDALVKLVVRRLSMIEAWNRFCRDLGLSPEKVAQLPLSGPQRDWLMVVVDHTVADAMEMALEPDESQVKARHDEWREFWSRAREQWPSARPFQRCPGRRATE